MLSRQYTTTTAASYSYAHRKNAKKVNDEASYFTEDEEFLAEKKKVDALF